MSQVRRRTVTPSPLSQSTSAVHLHVQEAEQAHIPRKLSKRRKPVVSGIFSGPEGSVSAPTTPYDRHNPADRSSVISPASLNAPSVIPSHLSSEKKEKRGSVLGRLAKKFSLLRKPQHGPSPSGDEWQHVDGAGRESRQSRVEPSAQKPELHTQRSADPPRRVPAPSVDNEQATIAAPASVDRPGHPSDDTSSLEAPFTIGKLTVANPDAPSSYGGSPDLPEAPLPPDDVAHMPTMSEEPLPLATSPEPMSPALPHASNGASKADHRVSADATPRREDKRMSSAHDRHARTSTAPSAASVPFPSGAPPLSPPDPARFSAATSAYTEGSPLSEVSVMANPPTPYVPPAPIPEAPAPAPQPPAPAPSPEKRSARKSSPQKRHSEAPEAPKLQMPTPLIDAPAPQSHASPREERHSSRDTSPAKPSKPEVPPKDARAKAPSSVTSRETETFRLVRSPSGGMMPSGATITAGGEQWQIVGSEGPRRSKTKEGGAKSKDRSKDRDSPMSKDRDDTKSKDRDSTMSKERESGSRREHKRQDKGEGESRSRTKSQVRPKLATVPVAEHSSSSMQSSSKASRGRSLDRSDADQAHHRLKENGSAPANIDKPQPPPPAPTPAPGPRTNLERRSSKNARPSSELVPTAELNTMRARETWEMDRLWKGRSMYNENGIAIGPVPSPPANGELARDDSTIRSAGHGSSHTSFMVQSPFQGQYSSSSSANAYRATSPQDYFYPHDSQDAVSPPLSNNPLPDPPRPSPYQPAPLPPPLSESHEVHNAEYWTKYAGLTAAH
ncbi:hypothetical protein PLICRDRAFT_418438 [Plicaturopsis crispa FD-325 SS-3]|nr:hypothetical protein PLICRDRAFT_418438 [Plicaturopsis crispa FD-325 SS-3]